jgi:hypothetical protein
VRLVPTLRLAVAVVGLVLPPGARLALVALVEQPEAAAEVAVP